MTVKKARWSKVYESSEEELQDFLQSRGIQASRFAIDAFEQSAACELAAGATVFLAEGSATLTAQAKNYSMQPGDMLSISEAMPVTIAAGMTGCVYYETT